MLSKGRRRSGDEAWKREERKETVECDETGDEEEDEAVDDDEGVEVEGGVTPRLAKTLAVISSLLVDVNGDEVDICEEEEVEEGEEEEVA